MQSNANGYTLVKIYSDSEAAADASAATALTLIATGLTDWVARSILNADHGVISYGRGGGVGRVRGIGVTLGVEVGVGVGEPHPPLVTLISTEFVM